MNISSIKNANIVSSTTLQDKELVKIARTGEKSFLDVGNSIKILDSHLRNWQAMDKQIESLSKKIPQDMIPLIKLQRMVHSLEFESQLITKVGDSVSGTLRRLQQFTN